MCDAFLSYFTGKRCFARCKVCHRGTLHRITCAGGCMRRQKTVCVCPSQSCTGRCVSACVTAQCYTARKAVTTFEAAQSCTRRCIHHICSAIVVHGKASDSLCITTVACSVVCVNVYRAIVCTVLYVAMSVAPQECNGSLDHVCTAMYVHQMLCGHVCSATVRRRNGYDLMYEV